MNVDYLIVGKGLAGSIFAWKAIKAGKSVKIFDIGNGHSSTRVAAGIVNPVTGRNNRLSWKAEILIPYALDFYKGLESELNIRLIHELPLLKLLHDNRSRNEWDALSGEPGYKDYLLPSIDANGISVIAPGGVGRILNSFRIDTVQLLDQLQAFFDKTNIISISNFEYNNLVIGTSELSYENLRARRIIFCEGFYIQNNPYFSKIQHTVAKGEVMKVDIDGLLPDAILNKNGYVVPLGNKKYWVGATSDWSSRSFDITLEGRNELEEKLTSMIKIPFTILDQYAGIRPTSKDRFPIVGIHPEYSMIAVFNGLGSKGISMAPFFAQQLLNHIENNDHIWKEVNCLRFYK